MNVNSTSEYIWAEIFMHFHSINFTIENIFNLASAFSLCLPSVILLMKNIMLCCKSIEGVKYFLI